MQSITNQIILDELAHINTPLGGNLVSDGFIESIVIDGSHVSIIIKISENLEMADAEKLREQAESLIASYSGVKNARAVLTGKVMPTKGDIKVEARSGAKPGVNPPTPKAIAGINKIILVGSGKGGVGKSTVAVNFAVSLSEAGHKVGLVDADIYGPSVAKMLGLSGKPDLYNGKMVPPQFRNLKVMSMGLLLDENMPVVWRGPMVSKALQQLMYGASWGDLDYLIVDLPPGTGDVHLSIAQNFKADGVIMVSTPQEVALLDVKKALSMFEKVNIPIIGIVENMSYFIDPASGNKTEVFGSSSVEKYCTETNIKLLAKLPLEPKVAIGADSGTPAVLNNDNFKVEFEKISSYL